MSRQLFLFFISVALLVGATCIYGGVRPGEIDRSVIFEYKADLQSLREDVRIVHQQTRLLRADLLILWLDARSDAGLLQADAHFQARHLAKPFKSDQKF